MGGESANPNDQTGYLGLGFVFFEIVEQILISSSASFQLSRAKSAHFGSALTTIRNQCFVSRATRGGKD